MMDRLWMDLDLLQEEPWKRGSLREEMALEASMFGPVAMVANLLITVTVMVMPPVFSLSASVVLVKMEIYPGIQSSVAQLWQQPTALEAAGDKLYSDIKVNLLKVFIQS